MTPQDRFGKLNINIAELKYGPLEDFRYSRSKGGFVAHNTPVLPNWSGDLNAAMGLWEEVEGTVINIEWEKPPGVYEIECYPVHGPKGFHYILSGIKPKDLAKEVSRAYIKYREAAR